MREECSKRDFFSLYTTPEIADAFGRFWDNENGVQDKFAAFWQHVAKRFDRNPNVIGYDIINEPFTANMYKDSMLFADRKKFDREVLTPFYAKIAKEIREVDDLHIIFFEPTQFPDVIPLNGGIVNNVGFEGIIEGDDYRNRTVLDDHLYCCFME